MKYMVAQGERLLGNGNAEPLQWNEDEVPARTEACYPVSEGLSLAILPTNAESGGAPLDLRAALAEADDSRFATLARAAQIATWHDRHRFCGRCGHALQEHGTDLARECPACNLVVYPRISPCIIVLVTQGERCLLARNPRFPAGRYSTLAGFIEAGETAEAAVAREVQEEVGIEVCNIRYVTSQSWPFPHSLMLGFFADHAGGELRPDGEEITDAGWFDGTSLPDLPPPFTISRQLIDLFLQRK